MFEQEKAYQEEEGPKYGTKYGLAMNTVKQLELSSKIEVKARKERKPGYQVIWEIIEQYFEDPIRKWERIEKKFQDADNLMKKFRIIKNAIRVLGICTDEKCPAFPYYSLEEKINDLTYTNPEKAFEKLGKCPNFRDFEQDYYEIEHQVFKFKSIVEKIFTINHGFKERRREAQKSNEDLLRLMDGVEATAQLNSIQKQMEQNENYLDPLNNPEPDRDYKWKNKKHGRDKN